MTKSIKHAVMDTSGKIHIEYDPEPSVEDIIKISEASSKWQTEEQARIEALEIDAAKMQLLFNRVIISFQAVAETMAEKFESVISTLQAFVDSIEADKPEEVDMNERGGLEKSMFPRCKEYMNPETQGEIYELKAKLADANALIERLVEAGEVIYCGRWMCRLTSEQPLKNWNALVDEWNQSKGEV